MKTIVCALLLSLFFPVLFPFQQQVRAALGRDDSTSAPSSRTVSRRGASSPETAGAARQSLSRLPIDFIENQGQWDKSMRFVARKGRMLAGFGKESIKIALSDRSAPLSLDFIGASASVEVTGEQRRSATYNFFTGNDRQRWRSDVSSYAAVLYRGLYEGIDMRVRESAGKIEYDLILSPSARPEKVKIRAEGASRIEISRDGSLLFDTASGQMRQSPPVSWEELPGGVKRPVRCRFRKIDAKHYGFEVEGRRAGARLVIDPGIEWATYLGGGEDDTINDLALARDGSGDIIILGFTRSVDFPATRGQLGPTGQAPFVARLNSTGTTLIYSTLFGGSGVNSGLGLAVDASSGAVVVGTTSSADFPVTPGAYDTSYNGDFDAFAVRFNSTGSQMLFSTYLGGTRSDATNPTQGYEEAWAVGLDPAGSVIVAGNTTSRNFPATAGAYDTTANPYVDANNNSMQDSFVSRLNPTGTALTYSTFLGGQGIDYAAALVVNAQGVVTLAGRTLPVTNRDTNGNDIPLGTPFPTTSTAFDRTLNGNHDIYVARLRLDGAGAADLKYSTLIGGNDSEEATAIALDPNNPESITITGWSFSGNYPVTPGVIGPVHFNPFDTSMAIVTRLNLPAAGGGSLAWSTFFGAPGNQQADDLVIDSSGAVIIAGATGTLNPPTTERAYDRTPARSDGFVARISPDGTQLLYSTLIGGAELESRLNVALAGGNSVIVAGDTNSTDFPVTPGAYDPLYGATGAPTSFTIQDLFIARLSLEAIETGDTSATPPELLSPATGSSFTTVENVNFDWTDAADPSGVEAYHLQVSPNSSFTDNFLAQINGWYETWTPTSQAGIDFPRGTFFWRVRTLDSAHNLSAWSAVRSFTVGTPTPPATPTLLSPANGARVNQPITFDWSDVSNAASYTIQIDNSSNLSAPFTVNVTLSESRFTSNSLPRTTLWWRVRANGFDGRTSNWSSVRSVRVNSNPAPALALSTLSLSPTTVVGGNPAQGTVTLTGAAPSGGAVVAITSSNSAVASTPQNVTVAAGATSASFSVSTAAVSASTPVTITASFGGVTRSATLTVTSANTPAPVTLSSLTLTPTSVTGGNSSQGRVTLTGAAPAGGATVSLASSNTTVATTPASVTVAGGATSATFTVTTRSVAASTSAVITASFGGVSRTATLSITAAAATDTVAIQQAEYSTGNRSLRVEATSTSSSATLTVFVTSTNAQIGVLRNEGGGRYRGELSWPSNPQNITVRSSLGGSATRTVIAK